MASRFVNRLTIRPSTGFLRSAQPLAARPPPGPFLRTYASDASPGQSSNVTNPQGASIESKQVNESRGMDKDHSPDTASLQTPVSDPSSSGMGQQEEEQPAMEQLHRDPSEPDEKKREHVEKMGQTPLDAADK